MNAIRRMASLAVLGALCLTGSTLAPVWAQDASAGGAGQQASQQKYTMAEYNAYQAAAAETSPAAQLKLLDDFVSKYPNSALLFYIYRLYYENYGGQKNFPRTIEFCDKLVALGDKAPIDQRYRAFTVRAYAFSSIQNPDVATAKAARAAALAGLEIIPQIPKPKDEDDAKFAEEKKLSVIYFNGIAANAAMAAKDYPSAIESFKVILGFTPDDVLSNYNLGKAYMGLNPPQQLDALWHFARAASKNSNEQQSKQVKAYLRKLMVNYQGGTVCDALTDAEMNELLQLAGSSADRPGSYKLFSGKELDDARGSMTIASVVTDLKTGGDKAKLTWTSACGLQFPDVPAKMLEVTPGDTVDIKCAFVTSQAEFDAATTPNMEVQIAGQPAAGKLEKESSFRITGTLESYDPDPAFMLHWDKAKVNEEDLPKEKTPAKKPAARKPAPKN